MEVVSPVGVPWRLIVFRKKLPHFSQKGKPFSYIILCFLITFIWGELLNGTPFAQNFSQKKEIFFNLVPKGFCFSDIRTAARNLSKRQKPLRTRLTFYEF